MKHKVLIITLIGIAIAILICFIPLPSILAFKISLSNTVKGAGVGLTGRKPMQYKRYEVLKAVSSTHRLLKLFKYHPSPAVKCYSYWALTERKSVKDYLSLVNSVITDDRRVKTQFGCIFSSTTVADFVIQSSYKNLSIVDSITLDSLILYSNIHLESLKYLLMSIQPLDQYYDRIRDLALDASVPSAIVALAKYNKPQDLDLIRSMLLNNSNDPYYPLLAIKNNPNDLFLPYLLDIQLNMIKKVKGINHIAVRALYKALIRYENKEIEERLSALVHLDNILQSEMDQTDSIQRFDNLDSLLFYSEIDSSRNTIYGSYVADNNYTVHCHVSSLRLALFDYPNSIYQPLVTRMSLKDYEIKMIQEEYDLTEHE